MGAVSGRLDLAAPGRRCNRSGKATSLRQYWKTDELRQFGNCYRAVWHMSQDFDGALGRRHVRALTIVAIALAAVLSAGRAQRRHRRIATRARTTPFRRCSSAFASARCGRPGRAPGDRERQRRKPLHRLLSGHQRVGGLRRRHPRGPAGTSASQFDYTSYRELGPLRPAANGTADLFAYVEGTDFV